MEDEASHDETHLGVSWPAKLGLPGGQLGFDDVDIDIGVKGQRVNAPFPRKSRHGNRVGNRYPKPPEYAGTKVSTAPPRYQR